MARTPRLTRTLAVTTAAAVALALSAGTATAHENEGKGKRAKTTSIQLLSFNDLHGNLQPPAGSGGRVTTGYTEVAGTTAGTFAAKATTVDAGGVEYLATRRPWLPAT